MPSNYTLTNTGYLAQSPTVGLYLAAGGTVTNTGTIIGAGDRFSYSGAGGLTEHTYDGTGIISAGPLTLVNSGEVYGIETGVSLSAGGNILNAGLIEATGAYRYNNNVDLGITRTRYPGTALVNASGALALTVLPGAEFIGAVTDAPGDGTLILGGSTEGTLDISSFSGFSSIAFAPSTGWTLQGGTSQLAAGERINGFTFSDTLVLDGFAATGSSYISGTGLVLSNATASETLDITGSFGNDSFTTMHANGDTTITAQISTISTYVSFGYGFITLGRYDYATDLTITNTGGLGTRSLFGAGIRGSGTVVNAGGIDGGVELGTGTVINTGFIDNAIYLGSGLVVDTGQISPRHDLFDAISAQSSLTVLLEPDANILGTIVDAAGDGTLVLGGSTAGTINLSSFSGLPTIEILAGSDWTLESGSGSGFVQGDRLIFEGFSATANTYISGTGLVLSNATASETLHLPGLDAHELNMVAGSDGTTIMAPISTISTYVSLASEQRITLGYGGYATNLTITSSGTISGGSNYGLQIIGDGMITNAGIIGGLSLGTGTIINTGFIDGYIGAIDLGSGVIIDSGTITCKAAPIEAYGSVAVIIEPGAAFSGLDGSDFSDATGKGTLVLGTGLGQFSLDPIVTNSLSGFDAISFAPGNMDLSVSIDKLGGGITLQGFTKADKFDIDQFQVSTAAYIAGTGIVITGMEFENYSIDTTLAISGGAPAGGFVFTTQDSGLEITAACFCRGTRIGTPRGDVAVEALTIGDMITTDLGPARIKWIGRRAYEGAFIAGNHLALPVKIRRHALAFNVPSRDVFISPDHGVCEGGVFVPAWRLVNGVSITQAQSVEQVEYFHIELEKPAVIFAEHMPVESFVDADCRQRFQNAAEYALLYPEPTTPQRHARPRVEDGFLLQRIKARIDARAGLTPTPSTGPLRGYIDETTPHLRGWAQDTTAPETPVLLEILHNGTVIGTILANRYRPDLRKAGLGSGCHAFELPAQGNVTLRRASDGARVGAEGLRKARGSARCANARLRRDDPAGA